MKQHLSAAWHPSRTPLWQAAKKGHEAVVILLLEKGAEKSY
jgi:hypothetical protein